MVQSDIAYTRCAMTDDPLVTHSMLPNDGSHVNDECIPFTQLDHSAPMTTHATNEQTPKGNGTTPEVLLNRLRHPRLIQPNHKSWMCFLSTLCTTLLLLLVIFICMWLAERQLNDKSCLEPNCVITSADIQRSMDSSYSACDNFYNYVCNGWVKQNPIPYGQNQWSILKAITREVDFFSKRLLENESIPNPSRGMLLAKTYYRACMNLTALEHLGLQPIHDQLKTLFGGWANLPQFEKGGRKDGGRALRKSRFNLTKLFIKLMVHTSAANPLFALTAGRNARNASQILIKLLESEQPLQKEYYWNKNGQFNETIQAYKDMMKNYSKLLGVKPENLNELDEVYELEALLAKSTLPRGDPSLELNYRLSTIDELEKKCNILQWKVLFDTLYSPFKRTIARDEIIALPEEGMFLERCKIFEKYLGTERGIRIIHSTVVWQFLWQILPYTPHEVRQLCTDFYKVYEGYDTESPRWTVCLYETQRFYGFVLGRHFVNQHFKPESKKDAEYMISAIKNAFKKNLGNFKWMKEEDRQRALKKVNYMGASVGYPGKIHNLTIEKDIHNLIKNLSPVNSLENFMTSIKANTHLLLSLLFKENPYEWDLAPHVVNAFYNEEKNHIYFPAGILQNPIYSHLHPKALNYGGIGVVVGHEITHAFDRMGSKRDEKGNLANWWSNETIAGFNRYSQCMIDQYSNYSVDNFHVNGEMTLSENMADNLGLMASFKAFKKEMVSSGGYHKLPGLGFTDSQLFFIAFGQLWCTNITPQSIGNTLATDVHTIEQFRVIGTLQNSVEFSRAFNCPVGSYMNPKKKCIT